MPRKPRSAAPVAPPPATLCLPDELTIYTVGELHPQWLGWMQALPQDGPPVTVDGSAIEQIDAAGLQLLLALERALIARGLGMALAQPSASLREGCAGLGLGAWLQANEAQRTAITGARA